jgi:hypothetical protein
MALSDLAQFLGYGPGAIKMQQIKPYIDISVVLKPALWTPPGIDVFFFKAFSGFALLALQNNRAYEPRVMCEGVEGAG